MLYAATPCSAKLLSCMGTSLQMCIGGDLSNYFADMSCTNSVSFTTGNRVIDAFQSNQTIINNQTSTDNTEPILTTLPNILFLWNDFQHKFLKDFIREAILVSDTEWEI